MINFRVDNQLALVSGCSRGIGFSMATALADAGANIIGVSHSMPASGSKIQQEVEAKGKNFYPFTCDFSNRKSVYEFLEKVKAEHPQIDILVNNAGSIQRKPVAEHGDDLWDNIIDINLNSQFIITREIGKRMLEKKQGKIISLHPY